MPKPLTTLIGGLCGTIVAVVITSTTNPSLLGAAAIGIACGYAGSSIGRELGSDDYDL